MTASGDAQGDCAGEVYAAGIKRGSGFRLARCGLAGDEALVDVRLPADDHAVGGDALAGPDQQAIIDVDGGRRDADDFTAVEQPMRELRFQRGQIAGHGAGAPAHRLVEIAATQQEEDQHHRRVEIGMLGMIGGLDERHAECQQDAERDRHVHVDLADAQRRQRAAEERLPGIGGRRQRDRRRQPVKQVTRFGRYVGEVAGPDRDREQHYVHRRKAGDGEVPQQTLCFLRFVLFAVPLAERMGAIAHAGERFDRLRGIEARIGPGNRQAPIGEIQSRIIDPAQLLQRFLDPPDTAAAIDALDRKLHAGRAIAVTMGERRQVGGFRDAHFRTTRLRDRKTRSSSRMTSITKVHCPAASGVCPMNRPGCALSSVTG